MSKASAPRFDPAAIKRAADAAGAKCYARGEGYFQQGQVALLSISQDKVIARAFGSETYAVRLTGEAMRIEGECTCPAFEDAGFCKHMVAAMLTANAAFAAGEKPDDRCAAIEAHLQALGHAELVGLITRLAETTPSLFRRLAADAGQPCPDDNFDEDW